MTKVARQLARSQGEDVGLPITKPISVQGRGPVYKGTMSPRSHLENIFQDTDLQSFSTLPYLLEVASAIVWFTQVFHFQEPLEMPIKCGVSDITSPRSLTPHTGVGASPGPSALGIRPLWL